MRRAGLLVLLVLLLAPPLRAQEAPVAVLAWDLAYAPDPEAGLVRVDVRLGGMDGVVTKLTFLTAGRRDAVTDVRAGPGTTLRDLPGHGFEVLVDGDESYSYVVDVRRDAFRPGERLAHVGPDFAVFKAESLALEYTYQYYEGRPFTNRTTVRLVPPPGWDAAGPWRATALNEYALPPGLVVPRGFVAFGPFEAREDRTVAGVRVHHVRLGAPAAFEPDLFAYVERAAPYYRAVYGHVTGPDLLVITAPDPMLRGGLGASDSLVAHEAADLRTLAHEYAHVHQLFGPDEDAGESSVWLTEGDADWHGALSLHAAGFWTPTQVNEFLREAERARNDPALRGARLPDATYDETRDGRSLERFAYQKGSVVLRALDARIRAETADAAGVPDLLRRLNAAHADRTQGDARVGNSEAALEASRVAGTDLSGFFARYVLGDEWPDPPPFTPAGDLGVVALRVEPQRAQPGAPVALLVEVTNQGTRPLARDLDVLVDGAAVARLTARLAVGETRTLRANLTAGAPGDHEVRVLHERVTYRSLAPARLLLGNVSIVPSTPRAGEGFDLLVFVDNAGETQGRARVEAAGEVEDVDVPPGGTAVATLQVLAGPPGNETLDVRLGEQRRAVPIHVLPVRAEQDDVPDFGVLTALLACGISALVLRRR